MKTVVGDIWKISTKHDAVVVTMNVGWRTRDGFGVLGKGLALQAARRFPWLAQAWGRYCQTLQENTGPTAWRVDSKWCRYLVAFPTKALDVEKPWLSWMADSSLELIDRCLVDLVGITQALTKDAAEQEEKAPLILVPSLGCLNGGLSESEVLPVMKKHLDGRNEFVHVRYER